LIFAIQQVISKKTIHVAGYALKTGQYMNSQSYGLKTDLNGLASPRATYGLIILFVAVYICELVFAVDKNAKFTPSVYTLAVLGGDIGARVKFSGEYWRMFTAPLMHADPLHILMNSFVLLLAGTAIERIVGWKWLLGLFALTALGGEIASLLFLAPNIVGVGASGGVMGVLAALFAIAGRMSEHESRAMRLRTIQFLVPSLIPIFYASGKDVNYFAHAGGAISGLVLGFVLLKLWRRDVPQPPFANILALVALGFFAVATYALIPIINLRGL
jgi:membrane associated rhomboid family serine protease